MVAPAHQQHAQDFAAVLQDPYGPAVEVNISTTAGVAPVRVIREPVDYAPYPQLQVAQEEREKLYVLRADLGPVPVPGSALIIDGERWGVEAVPWKSEVLQLIIVRYRA